MHVSFIPYGKRDCVEKLLRDMEAQKHQFRMYKGDKVKTIYIDGQVRVCPFGIMEYVFPKEDKDRVLASLDFNRKTPYKLGLKVKALRKLFSYKQPPKFSDKQKYLWQREAVSIIPIGIREDGVITGNRPQDSGWTHEAI